MPIHPNIERGYLQAILQHFNNSANINAPGDHPPPAGFKRWAEVPNLFTAYNNRPEEIDEWREECPIISEADICEQVKPVDPKFVQATGMVGKTIRHRGQYGTILGMRMGMNTMKVYYVVQFEDQRLRYFQNLMIEKLLVDVDLNGSSSKPLPGRSARHGGGGRKAAAASVPKADTASPSKEKAPPKAKAKAADKKEKAASKKPAAKPAMKAAMKAAKPAMKAAMKKAKPAMKSAMKAKPSMKSAMKSAMKVMKKTMKKGGKR